MAVIALLAAGSVVVVRRIDTPPPPVSVDPSLTSLTAASEADPALPWPAMGQAAVSIPAVGYTADSGPEHPVAVASMTKVMTAFLILRDHPLAVGAPGPNITITTGDAANYGTDTVSDQSSIDINPGEVMTESQLLAGMLVHSANDFAYTLAVWDAGSLPAFVAEMNAEAAALGMTQTHYVDASGFTPGSVSTPDDLLKVTALAMDNPAFAKDVTMPSVTLPVAGTISTYTPLLPGSVTGVPGVVGVKSGFTTDAGGGDILAYESSVDGKPFVTLAAVSSQQGPNVLVASGHSALALAQAAAGGVRVTQVVAAGQRVATASIPGHTTAVVAASGGSLLTWPGTKVEGTVVVTHRLHAGLGGKTVVGDALFTVGNQQVAVPVRTAGELPAPTLGQRLF